MVSRRDREKVLRTIIDFETANPNEAIQYPSKALHHINDVDVLPVLRKLKALGFITFDRVFEKEKIIYLGTTQVGSCYFENKSDKRREFWQHSVLVPIGVAIATTLFIQYVIPWVAQYGIPWIAKLLAALSNKS